MDYFNRCNDEELGGINYCSYTSTPTLDINSNGISGIKFNDITIDTGGLKIDRYDKVIKELSDKVEAIMKRCSFKQEKKISEWREFDLEAATGREFETRWVGLLFWFI